MHREQLAALQTEMTSLQSQWVTDQKALQDSVEQVVNVNILSATAMGPHLYKTAVFHLTVVSTYGAQRYNFSTNAANLPAAVCNHTSETSEYVYTFAQAMMLQTPVKVLNS